MCTWFNKRVFCERVQIFQTYSNLQLRTVVMLPDSLFSFASSFNIILLQCTNESINQVYFTSTQ